MSGTYRALWERSIAWLAARGVPSPWAEILPRAALLTLLLISLLAFSRWAGHVVAEPGGWLALDTALYRAINSLQLGPLTALFLVLLNEPGPNFLLMVVALFGYCVLRRRDLLLPVVLLL